MSDNHIGLLPTSYKGNAEDTNLLLDRFTNSRKARELEEKVRDREETTASITGLTGGISTAIKIAFTSETDYSKGSLGGKIKDLIFNKKATVLDVFNSIVATVPGISSSAISSISETIVGILSGIIPFIHLVVRYTFPAYAPLTGILNTLLKSTVDTPITSVLEMEVDKGKKPKAQSDSEEPKPKPQPQPKPKPQPQPKPKPKPKPKRKSYDSDDDDADDEYDSDDDSDDYDSDDDSDDEDDYVKKKKSKKMKEKQKALLKKLMKERMKMKNKKRARGLIEKNNLKIKLGGAINGVPDGLNKLISLLISLVSFVARRYKK